jgi:ribosomal protein L24E
VPVYREVNEMPKCASCGKLIPVGGIPAERLGRPVRFCSEQCVRIFDTYKQPKYGNDALAGIPLVH